MLLRDNNCIVGHDAAKNSKDIEAQVEEDPLNVGGVGVDVIAEYLSSKGNDSKDDGNGSAGDEGVDGALSGLRELVSALVQDCSGSEDVEDFTNDEEGHTEAVDLHVIVDVEEADHGTENTGQKSINEHGLVGAGRGDTGQSVVIGSHVGLLDAGVAGEHDGVELVKRSLAHNVADVWEMLVIAGEGAVSATHVTAGQQDTSHQERNNLSHVGEGDGDV